LVPGNRCAQERLKFTFEISSIARAALELYTLCNASYQSNLPEALSFLHESTVVLARVLTGGKLSSFIFCPKGWP